MKCLKSLFVIVSTLCFAAQANAEPSKKDEVDVCYDQAQNDDDIKVVADNLTKETLECEIVSDEELMNSLLESSNPLLNFGDERFNRFLMEQ